MKTTLTYDDVLLLPQYSDIKSRKEIDVGNDLDDKIHLDLPIISSPMDTVTESAMAKAMCKTGGLGIIHRYNSIEEQVKEMIEVPLAAAAIGVTEDFKDRARILVSAGVDVLCVDVAHGHHILVEQAIKTLKDLFGDAVHVMAGNVATKEAFDALSDWGADSIRCNIGGGSICSTRIQTGHGLPGLQTIIDCFESDRKAKIIADGGIKTSGDIVKALAAGADFVMLGSMLAGTSESPGKTIKTDSGILKQYRGMASKEAQMDWHGRTSSNEGVSTFIDFKGSVAEILGDLKKGIASGLSYSGARNLTEFREKAIFVRQTLSGLHESKTHILF
jgi:IMP dehydrogenase